mmetsp:Transcript_37652/g.69465  ORF Transcript_37652/g.69465 Transcript_37652/m.69465 type:complete len:307 (+) Transcript_37652:529-1449(+)
MMAHMRGSNFVVEPVEDAVLSVDGAHGRSLDPRPGLLAPVRDVLLGVLEPRVQNQPGVRPEVREEVHQGQAPETDLGTDYSQDSSPDDEPSRGEEDPEPPGGGEQLRGGAEVVKDVSLGDTYVAPELRVQAASTGGVDEEVHGPSEQQVKDNLEESEGIVSDGVVNLLVELKALLGRRHVCLSVKEVVGFRVVLGVGVLPGEVRDEEHGVEDEPDDIVKGLRRAESAVASLVCNDPPSGHGRALPKSVGGPEEHDGNRHVFVRQLPREVSEETDDSTIARHVVESGDGVPFETVLRNALLQLTLRG